MSSLLTQALVAEKYGLRVSMSTLCEILGIKRQTLNNRLGAGTLPIKTYTDVGGRFADYRDVAEHIDKCREAATSGANT
jgi:hypothetical protein